MFTSFKSPDEFNRAPLTNILQFGLRLLAVWMQPLNASLSVQDLRQHPALIQTDVYGAFTKQKKVSMKLQESEQVSVIIRSFKKLSTVRLISLSWGTSELSTSSSSSSSGSSVAKCNQNKRRIETNSRGSSSRHILISKDSAILLLFSFNPQERLCTGKRS